ncbi:MAG: hypothetical protein PHN60_03440 [Candidatus Gracilibacteria bacterium]|nr:hypothetical protein [Candidatus Gracilibacteria bacterium]
MKSLLSILLKYIAIIAVILSVILFVVGVITRDNSVFPYVVWGFILAFVDLILVIMEKQTRNRRLQEELRLQKRNEAIKNIQKRMSENKQEKIQATTELSDRHGEKQGR